MAGNPSGVGSSWNERMRLIRFRRKRERFRFWQEFKVVPGWMVWTMVTLYVIALAIVQIVNIEALGAIGPYPSYVWHARTLNAFALAGIVTAIAIPVATILFLIGYVYRDAKRRGMSAGAWTFLVIALLPAYLLLGFIVYFVMREPLPYDCPQCGTNVGARFNYCPNCNYNLHPSCPQCKREVFDGDKFCSFCGQSLSGQATTDAPMVVRGA
jgi:hypothetical protein